MRVEHRPLLKWSKASCLHHHSDATTGSPSTGTYDSECQQHSNQQCFANTVTPKYAPSLPSLLIKRVETVPVRPRRRLGWTGQPRAVKTPGGHRAECWRARAHGQLACSRPRTPSRKGGAHARAGSPPCERVSQVEQPAVVAPTSAKGLCSNRGWPQN